MKVTCAISGLSLKIPHISISLSSNAGYFHPIFALTRQQLTPLYEDHLVGKLDRTSSYLLFLAYFHSSSKVTWKAPCNIGKTLSHSTSSLPSYLASLSSVALINYEKEIIHVDSMVATTLPTLISMLESVDQITIPSFSIPSFSVTPESNSLKGVKAWITACNKNLSSYYTGYQEDILADKLQIEENALTKAILNGYSREKYTHIIANWADKAGGFPKNKAELWKKLIRTCYNQEKMFYTELDDLVELKEFCELNIPAGSIHFHELYATIRKGIKNHTTFLGGTLVSSDLNKQGYMILPEESEAKELTAIKATATTTAPIRNEYTSTLAYLKAKMAYTLVAAETTKAKDTLATKSIEELSSKVLSLEEQLDILTPTNKELRSLLVVEETELTDLTELDTISTLTETNLKDEV